MAELPAEFRALAAPFPDSAYKEVRGVRGGFTSLDAYHVVERLTAVFGLAGHGWGAVVEEWIASGDAIGATGYLWYTLPAVSGDVRYQVYADGDAVVAKGNVPEARKKARTNMISKAASYLGVGLSLYQGRHLDDPYLERAAASDNDPSPTTAPKAHPAIHPDQAGPNGEYRATAASKRFHAEGVRVFGPTWNAEHVDGHGDTWPSARAMVCAAAGDGTMRSAKQLSIAQLSALADQMQDRPDYVAPPAGDDPPPFPGAAVALTPTFEVDDGAGWPDVCDETQDDIQF